MSISITRLREDLYRLVDEVLETGKPLEITRKGRKLLLVPESPVSKLGKLRERKTIKGDPEELVHMDWSKEWNP
jgi:prevent-host-death family protein